MIGVDFWLVQPAPLTPNINASATPPIVCVRGILLVPISGPSFTKNAQDIDLVAYKLNHTGIDYTAMPSIWSGIPGSSTQES